MLLSRPDIDVNLVDRFGSTSLIATICTGSLGIAEMLVWHEASAAINKPTRKSQQTPLYIAVNGNRMDVVEILLNVAGIDCDVSDSQGRTPESLALSKGFYDINRLILGHMEDA